jgi:hypothetical protein
MMGGVRKKSGGDHFKRQPPAAVCSIHVALSNVLEHSTMTTETDSALTGVAFELANAGYSSMPDLEKKREEDAICSDSASLREAAQNRFGSPDDIIIRQYLDADGKPAAANEAVTLDRAGRDYARAVSADVAAMESETSKALAARVDTLRAEALARNPDAAEFYGFELPDLQADNAVFGQTEPEKQNPETSRTERAQEGPERAPNELDPEIERALQHPQVRQAIEAQLGEAEKTRQDYLDGLAAATQIAQVSFVSQFPELVGVAPESLPGALDQMSRQDPQRLARVQAMIATTEQLFAGQQQESTRQAELARQNFQDYAESEDLRLETMLKGESKATQRAVAAEIVASAKASGVETAELFRLFNSEPLMRNAAFDDV